jgi:hypothetical protein
MKRLNFALASENEILNTRRVLIPIQKLKRGYACIQFFLALKSHIKYLLYYVLYHTFINVN